jgi:hypothetical protein
MVRYLTMTGITVRPEVYPPAAAPEATRVSKDERRAGFFVTACIVIFKKRSKDYEKGGSHHQAIQVG